jgi:hypothetical protein
VKLEERIAADYITVSSGDSRKKDRTAEARANGKAGLSKQSRWYFRG